MPSIHFKDGTIKQVSYDTAAQIREIQAGERKPASPKQAQYTAFVKYIMFEPIKRPQTFTYKPAEPDEEMNRILADSNLRGLEKLRAVAQRIRQRNQ